MCPGRERLYRPKRGRYFSAQREEENPVKPFLRLLTLILSVSTAGLIWAQQDQPATGSQAPADNTKTNQRDRNPGEPTADQQKENGSDRALAQQVRRALVKDKSLSTYAITLMLCA
jgi:hypothetical protein